MPRWLRWMLAILAVAVVIAAVSLLRLRRREQELRRNAQRAEEQALRELTQPVIVTPSDVRTKARLFWAAEGEPGTLTPVVIELPLSNDPPLRAKQVLNTLLAGPVDAELRTLPADAALLEFYLLPDGTAIADFSEALSSSMPSGIQSEQLAVESIARTLEANVRQVRRLKILIHGQEVDTLAGHLDLTGYFPVSAAVAVPATPVPTPSSPPVTGGPASAPAPAAAGPNAQGAAPAKNPAAQH
jgi:spore germination protein GerM